MKKLKNTFRLIVVLLLVGGWALAASALHLIWTGENIVLVPKDRLAIRDTYVDTSAWTADDVAAHPTLSRRLVATGRADVLAKAFESTTPEELAAHIEEAIARGPTTQPTPTVNDQVADKVEQAAEKAKQAADQIKAAVE